MSGTQPLHRSAETNANMQSPASSSSSSSSPAKRSRVNGVRDGPTRRLETANSDDENDRAEELAQMKKRRKLQALKKEHDGSTNGSFEAGSRRGVGEDDGRLDGPSNGVNGAANLDHPVNGQGDSIIIKPERRNGSEPLEAVRAASSPASRAGSEEYVEAAEQAVDDEQNGEEEGEALDERASSQVMSQPMPTLTRDTDGYVPRSRRIQHVRDSSN